MKFKQALLAGLFFSGTVAFGQETNQIVTATNQTDVAIHSQTAVTIPDHQDAVVSTNAILDNTALTNSPAENLAVETNKQSSLFGFEFDAGVTYWGGELTDTIGGNTWDNRSDTWEVLEDPLSEIKYPFDLMAVSMDVAFSVADLVELYGGVDVAVTEPNTKADDSDWYEGQKIIYSEADADLDAWNGDFGLRVWVYSYSSTNSTVQFGIAPQVGYQQQKADWTMKNLDQWYPTYPWYEHARVSGKVATYDYKMKMTYAGLKTYISTRRFAASVSAGISVTMNMTATDDHVLRYKKSTSDHDGHAYFIEGEGRYYFARNIFLLGRATYLYSKADGYQEQYFYAGENVGWQGRIEGTIKSQQFFGTLGIGCDF